MTRERLAVGAALVALTLCGFFFFPGHTWLGSDTQIYMPILERLADPSLYAKDPVALRPHVSFTIYDEVALALRSVTGLELRWTLHAQQLVYRLLGLLGLFLIGRACGLTPRLALLAAAIFGLGATVAGPAVLTFEYEPVPRGFAVPLLVLAVGLAAHGRAPGAGIAAGVAVLYHPPTTVPVLAVFAVLTLRRRVGWRFWGPVAGAVLVTAALAALQRGETEPQRFLSTIGPELEKLQRLRGSYNFITLWGAPWVRHYEFLFVCAVVAWSRLRGRVGDPLRTFLIALPVYGLLMIPVSYVLLERWKWALLPQFQPARAVLWIVVAAVISGSVCAIFAALEKRWSESVGWFVLVFAIPAQADVLTLVIPDLREPLIQTRFAVVLALALLAWIGSRGSPLAWAAAMALPFTLIPDVGKTRNYRELDHPEMHQLAGWARSSTPKDTVFLLPDAGQELYPGLFRVYSLRNVYVDWKSGGQVNLLREFAEEWWSRWVKSGEGKFRPELWGSYAGLGVDYVILKAANRRKDVPVAYENRLYVVHSLR